MRCVLAAFIVVATLSGADIPSEIDDLIANSPALANGYIGIEIVSLTDGHVLYERNQDHLFVPASNTKLFTTALALIRLGPEYRFTTQIVAGRPIDSSGTLSGDLVLVGGGDPSLSGREYPYRYRPNAPADYSFRAIEDFGAQLAARGLKRVDGDIVGDDQRYVWSPYAAGWSFGDAAWEYGAPVSALIVNDNSFALSLRPAAQAGEPARVSLTPTFEYFTIDNQVRTIMSGERKIDVERTPSRHQLRLNGTIPIDDPGLTQLLAVDDPALYVATVLREVLIRQGVSIQGRAVARHRFPGDVNDPTKPHVVLAERSSPLLAEILQVVDKVSQNLHAEVLLREIGFFMRHAGTREAGLADLSDFLSDVGIPKDDYRFADGSGLSRNTLVTPAAITKLLAYMYRTPNRDVWTNLLPIAGVDGTLATRFPDHPEAHTIHAKTGTLSHVRANSGYLDSPEYGPLAFSILVNNYDAPTSDINKFLDAVELLLLH